MDVGWWSFFLLFDQRTLISQLSGFYFNPCIKPHVHPEYGPTIFKIDYSWYASCSRPLVTKTAPSMVVGTRVLKPGVSGPYRAISTLCVLRVTPLGRLLASARKQMNQGACTVVRYSCTKDCLLWQHLLLFRVENS